MTEKLFNFGQRVIHNLFYFFFLLTTYFAITSPNIILGDNAKTGSGTTLVTAFFIIAAVAIIICGFSYPKISRAFKWLFVQHQAVTASVLLAATVLWQIVFVLYVHPVIGFDVNAIHEALIDPKNVNTMSYFSQNANNLPILLMQHWLAEAFHTTSWLFFDWVTLFLTDLSALLNILCVAVLSRRKVPAAMYIHAGWLALFPMIIVPYTDAWVLPFVSAYVLCYCVMRYGHVPGAWKLVAAVGFGLAVAGAYFMKPSAIVGVIAIVLVEGLPLLKRSTWQQLRGKRLVLVIAVLLLSGGSGLGAYVAGNHVLDTQTYIKINTARSIPAVHFMSMGISGQGGYNAKDALKMAQLPTKKARSDWSIKMYLKRLKQRGFWGYLVFLIEKQRNNTADGSFAWIKEGHFILDGTKPKGSGFGRTLRNFIYLYGTNLGDFRYVAQVWWIVWLLMILFAWSDRRQVTQFLRLTMIGGFLFLLLFEGGRSRYLIQYLPAFLLLATLSYERSLNVLRRLFSWVNLPM
ncbi:TIGR03766 family XrtG-associated glycosyltransferase [Levilactobacillus andaensis]|uniref:TIGR03766 family XrtG-associated glycosyltransferase n=1 Tax=Levilactobacillus andaensis TaxID=2799570 RepID=UPI0019457D80|nr:TIGR03766 family XrtG-associated glycosyltransferase [Levilactobacillus andaensis]